MASALRPLFALEFTPTGGALATGVTVNENFSGLRPLFINLVMVNAIATAGVSGTAQLFRDTGGNGTFVAVTPALAMTTSGTTTINATSGAGLASGLAAATYLVSAGDVLRCAFVDGGGGGGANGRCTAHVVGLPIAGQ